MTANQILAHFPHPDTIGASEYRQVYDLLHDGLKSIEGEGEDLLDHAITMMGELEYRAGSAKRRLKELKT